MAARARLLSHVSASCVQVLLSACACAHITPRAFVRGQVARPQLSRYGHLARFQRQHYALSPQANRGVACLAVRRPVVIGSRFMHIGA